MHEVQTAKNILQMACEEAKRQGLQNPRAIRVRVGAWTGIDVDHLKHDFHTVAPTVSLDVETVEPSARCEDCGARFEAKPGSLSCDKCGSRRVTLEQRRDIELISVE
ncbi:MAG: hydrogenase maturation nickel metallochaperone HypA [Armatimonadota bacterium]|nr:hydrogenase maturation nickel metallochaperone HypA [Armatimonadota bacterium]